MASQHMPPSRDAIRRRIRQQRRQLTPRDQQRHGEALARRLVGLPLFQRSRHIAFYLANDGELDLAPLLERSLAMGKRCYLPVLGPAFHNRLWFAPFDPDSCLVLNTFGIPEPVCNWRQARRPWGLDLILTPLVAFDEQGNRLGMGGGFYDRTLAYLTRRQHWHKPHLLGVAHELQKVEALPHAAWDIPLQGVATEAGHYAF